MPPELTIPPLGTPTPTPESEPSSNNSPSEIPQETLPASLGNEFLNGVPEQDRNIVGKYIGDWDGKVTKRFQEIHDQYKPYKDLGVEVEQIQAALRLQTWAMNDPLAFYNSFKEVLDGLAEEGLIDMSEFNANQPPVNEQVPNQNNDPVLPEFEGLSPKFVEMFQKQSETLSALAQKFEERDNAAEEQRQMAELDDYMKSLHNAGHDFDDEFFLSQLASGRTPEQALQAWDNLKERVVNSRPKPPAPNGYSGPGSIGAGQVDPKKLEGADRTNYVAQMLAAANQQS